MIYDTFLTVLEQKRKDYLYTIIYRTNTNITNKRFKKELNVKSF